MISLEKAILKLHDMAAGIFEIPELMVTENEAKDLSDCVKDVSQYYVESFDPKKVAMFNLVTCIGGMYSLRIAAYRNRMEQQRRANLQIVPRPTEAQAPIMSQPAPAGPLNPDPNPLAFNPPPEGGDGY